MMTDDSSRFQLRLTDDDETGNDVGSDLELNTRADNGSYKHRVFTVNRDTGEVEFFTPVHISGGLEFPSELELPNGLRVSDNLAVDGESGSSKNLSFYSDGIPSWVLRENGDGDFQLVSRDAAGAYLASVFKVVKATNKLTFSTPPHIGAAELDPHLANALPSATDNPNQLMICSNGDGGAPCLVLSWGGVWRRISLGNAI